jgi:A/G-specific adenine glycosylase
MELGATICTAKAPACSRCPLRAACADYAGRRAADEQLLPLAVRSLKKVAENPAPRFVGSNRYFRGRIIDVLRAVPANAGLSEEALLDAVVAYGEPIENATFVTIVTKLAVDGLVVLTADGIRLPN